MAETERQISASDLAEVDRRPAPWRRFIARAFDLWVGGTIFWFGLTTVIYAISLEMGDAFAALASTLPFRILDGPINLMVMVPIQAALIGGLGYSPGKWLCGIKVRDRQGNRLGLGRALRRELSVWTRGYGLGVPVVNLFCLFRSYSHLEEHGATVWDEAQDLVVEHGSLEGPRILGLMLCIAVVLGGILWNLSSRFQALGAGY